LLNAEFESAVPGPIFSTNHGGGKRRLIDFAPTTIRMAAD